MRIDGGKPTTSALPPRRVNGIRFLHTWGSGAHSDLCGTFRRSLPGLRSYMVNAGAPNLVAGSLSPFLIAELEFDSMAQLQNAMGSTEGQAATADLGNFAQAGVTILAFDPRRA
jgi:uncharacterized protein (TIGR02118 family)